MAIIVNVHLPQRHLSHRSSIFAGQDGIVGVVGAKSEDAVVGEVSHIAAPEINRWSAGKLKFGFAQCQSAGRKLHCDPFLVSCGGAAGRTTAADRIIFSDEFFRLG